MNLRIGEIDGMDQSVTTGIEELTVVVESLKLEIIELTHSTRCDWEYSR